VGSDFVVGLDAKLANAAGKSLSGVLLCVAELPIGCCLYVAASSLISIIKPDLQPTGINVLFWPKIYIFRADLTAEGVK
jgi:hypothetical protein